MNANEFSPISKIHTMRVYAGRANPEDSLIYEKWEEELRNLLDRYRIRDAATEPPTMEDGGTGNHAPYVMARENKYDFWEEIELEWVAAHPDEYPQWTCVPQLPEVE